MICCSIHSLYDDVSVLTNSLDVLRANIQVRRIKSILMAARILWKEERWNIFIKGISARITHSALSSTFIAAGYETLKRLSLHEKYRGSVKW